MKVNIDRALEIHTKYNDLTDEELHRVGLGDLSKSDEREWLDERFKRREIAYAEKVSKMTPEEFRKFHWETHWLA